MPLSVEGKKLKLRIKERKRKKSPGTSCACQDNLFQSLADLSENLLRRSRDAAKGIGAYIQQIIHPTLI